MGQMGPIGRPPSSDYALRHMGSLFLAVLYSPIMTNQAFSSDIRRYALAGAQARVAEITQEVGRHSSRLSRAPRRTAPVAPEPDNQQ